MEFGKNILEKYGWKEGQGIGKNADGIVKPIKANLKFDTAGFGHDRAKEFTNHWWERAFNEAAQNINVHDSSDHVAMSVKDADSLEISTSSFSVKKLQMNSENGVGYKDAFLKSRSLLHKEISSDDSDDESNCAGQSFNFLSDEQLLKACGGRTAHKGARHGLKLSGKLSRIEAQEQQMLANKLDVETAQNTFKDWYTVKKSKKSKRRKKEKVKTVQCEKRTTALSTSSDTERLNALIDEGDYVIKIKSKKKKKTKRRLEDELSNSMKRLQTDSPTRNFDMDNVLHGILDYSKAIKKEKNRKQKNKTKKKSKK